MKEINWKNNKILVDRLTAIVTGTDQREISADEFIEIVADYFNIITVEPVVVDGQEDLVKRKNNAILQDLLSENSKRFNAESNAFTKEYTVVCKGLEAAFIPNAKEKTFELLASGLTAKEIEDNL